MALLLTVLSVVAADDRTGEQIYRQHCASCHGSAGEGTKDNPEPLVGHRPLDKLAPWIEKNMPKDAPKKCSPEDAKRVAEYIYNAFYSPAAQARNKPPRVELARLTVGQYRNALADLLAGFGEAGKWDDKRGLRGEYFNSKRAQNDKRVIDRVEPVVNLRPDSPLPSDKLNAEEQFFRWSGAVLAPDSGEYEFNLETANGARLWLNDLDRTLVDAWVRSGDGKRHAETITLLGGRVYPLRAEVFKAKNEKTVSAVLKWKRPHHTEEVIPERNLSPGRFPETFVLKTPFPPDDRSMGYERGTSISKAWDEASTYSALDAAAWIGMHLERLSGRKPGASDSRERFRDFGRRFAERAFRRPLAPDQAKFFVDRHFEGDSNPELAVKKCILLVLMSPRFLYAELNSHDAFDVASRISLGLWDSLPDAELMDAARKGGLATAEGVSKQVERMLPDLRTRAKIREFFHHWLQLDRIREQAKDPNQFPGFSDDVLSDLRTSLDLFLDEVTWSEASDFRQLLLSEAIPLNGRLAKLYGADLAEEAPFQDVALGADRQAGVLTHPLLMAGFATNSASSPIHRGVFLARSLLGKRLRPPPDAVTPIDPELQPELTTRERTALQTRSQACQSCHSMINPLGFSLEHYDAIGRFRNAEKNKPIDATGSYSTPAGESVRFNGARDLGAYLARSEETQSAFIEHLFHALVKQPLRAYGADRPESLRESFVKNGYSIRRLVAEMVATSALAGDPNTKGRSP
jgi:hypothetical protein